MRPPARCWGGPPGTRPAFCGRCSGPSLAERDLPLWKFVLAALVLSLLLPKKQPVRQVDRGRGAGPGQRVLSGAGETGAQSACHLSGGESLPGWRSGVVRGSRAGVGGAPQSPGPLGEGGALLQAGHQSLAHRDAETHPRPR